MPGIKSSLTILIILFLFSFFVAIPFELFDSIPNLDVFLHFFGGAFIALLVYSYYSNEFKGLSQPFAFFALIGIVIGVGVFWEFFEHILGAFFADAATDFYNLPIVNFHGDLADTIQDLFMDVLGGSVVGLIAYIRRK